jgi:hypothetical protein
MHVPYQKRVRSDRITPALILLLPLVIAACSSEVPSVESLPEGNADSGADLFARSII